MAVFQEQDSGGCRFELRPNCALSWRGTKYLIWFFTACFAAVAGYFTALGAWLVLPFAGLELVVLVAGFYLSALAGHTREVVEIEGPVLRVMRGRRRLEEIGSFPANWTQVALRRDPRGWYPSRLLLCCHGKGLEIATKLVEEERAELAASLQDILDFRLLRAGGADQEPVSAASARSGQPGHGVSAALDAEAHAMVGTSLASNVVRAAGCARGAFTKK